MDFVIYESVVGSYFNL